MPVKIQNSFSPTTEVGQALNNAITAYANNIPTAKEAAETELVRNKVRAPQQIAERLRGLYGTSGGEGAPLTPQMVQDSIAGLAEATANGGDVGKLGELMRVAVMNAANPANTVMQDNSMLGAGDSYSSTRGGFREAQQNDLTQTAMNNKAAMDRTRYSVDSANSGSASKPGGAAGGDLNAGKTMFDQQLQELTGLYDKLDAEGAAISTDNDFVQNKLNQFFATPGSSDNMLPRGQDLAQGSVAQSIRNQIESKRQALRLAVMQASGMGTKVFDSNKELEAFMRAITTPGNDIQASKATIRSLSQQYGYGTVGEGSAKGGTGDSPGMTPMRKVIGGQAYINRTGNPADWELE